MTKKSEIETNGNGNFKYFGELKNVSKVPEFWKRLEFNEWTFSLLLFFFSLVVVIVKIAINYGFLSPWLVSDTQNSYRAAEFNSSSLESVSENNEILAKYGWIMKAALSGLATVGFTWYIIYKDSNIPGINPPSPFKDSKRRLKKELEISTNYLMGLLNGLLIFVYMCF